MIENYIGWASHVNKIILSTTNITSGENATKTDNLSSGGKRTTQNTGYIPDKYNVQMEFEWEENAKVYNSDGEVVQELDKNEYQLFMDWYKYQHKFGAIPFEFPKILYSPSSGIKIVDEQFNNREVEYYKITSAVPGQKSGSKVAVNMTWESVYGGAVTIEENEARCNGISYACSTYIDISFSALANTEPVSGLFKVYVDSTEVPIRGFFFDEAGTVRLYFEELSAGSHSITFSMNEYGGLIIYPGDDVSVIVVEGE